MKRIYYYLISCLALGLFCLTTNAAEEATTITEWLSDGAPLLNVRARVENADQEGRESSTAVTIRTRLGYKTATMNGWAALIDFEDIRALDEGAYNPYPVAGKTVIADPVGTELNRAQLSYSGNGYSGVIGRQRIILNGARFVGNVGWRQNEQTFDAAVLKYNDENMSFFYGYIDQVNRIFGDDAPADSMRRFQSDSHLINGSFSPAENIKVVAYGYLLNFSNAAANSTDTFGASVSGSFNVADGSKLNYYLEYANQSDAANSALDYNADYYHINVGGKISLINAKIGYEVLGSDNGVGFKTPLATLHKYNGWTDAFLGTPADGLEDFYVQVGGKIDGATVNFIYHNFSTNVGGKSLGDEFDLVGIMPISDQWKLIAKGAILDGANGQADINKYWFEVDFNF